MKLAYCLALTLAAPAAAQGITLAEGDTAFTVRVVPERDPAAPGTVLLENAEFLPIDITGRTIIHELDASRPRRLFQDGLWRIEMPGQGRLLHYRRDGGLHHGFLSVPANGVASVVLERAGVGGTGTGTPFADRIAVAADGTRAAVPLLGGGLELLDLRSGTRKPRSGLVSNSSPRQGAPLLQAPAPPVPTARHRFVPTAAPVVPGSLMLGTHAFFVTEDERLWRVSWEQGSLPEDVTPPPVTDGKLKDELAMSGDGTAVVILYGPKEQQNLWILSGSGPAAVLPPPASKYEEPNYLPDGPGQARLLLNDDGTRLLYTDNSIRDEIYLLDIPPTTTHQLTGDDNFEPYIGVGILPFFRASTLFISIGDPDRTDWFIADATPGSIANLTLTGPTGGPPFAEGELAPETALLTPGSLLVTEATAAGGVRLRCMTPSLPQGQILYEDVSGTLVPGTQFEGRADILVNTSAGDRLLDGNNGTEMLAVPAGISLSPPAHGPGGTLSVFRASFGGLGTAVFRLPDGTLLSTPAEPDLEQVVLTADGGALINGETLRYLRPGVLTVVPTAGAPKTVVLSGAGS